MARAYRLRSAAMLDARATELGVSSRSLARSAGHADHSYIARLRRGASASSSVTEATAQGIARALEVPLLGLFEVADRGKRYGQCDETCTADCGHCKGAAQPVKTGVVTPRYSKPVVSECVA